MRDGKRDVLTIIMAGGKGERLYPLTKSRSKPAVPFGGIYRIIDFTLSNCLNSGLRRIKVLTQYMSNSLDRHLKEGWNFFCRDLGEYIDTVPPQHQLHERWYNGTADAIFQNLHLLEEIRPPYLLILSGDHIYRMDYSDMIDAHLANRAELTVATVEVEIPLAAGKLGVLQADHESRIVDFEEKPAEPKPSPTREGYARVNMGIYVFDTDVLVRNVIADAKTDSSHDFGRDVIPSMIGGHRCYSYNFVDDSGGEIMYWRDIGTLENYFDASMDLLSHKPHFDLYDPAWPLRTYMAQNPPAKMIHGEPEGDKQGRQGTARNSIISPGCIIDGAKVSNCVLSPGVYIGPGAEVEDSIIMHRTRIGANCRVRRALIDQDVVISPGRKVGLNPQHDSEHFILSDSGIVLVPKGFKLG
ncbi:MAG: glucose-1-phosphate adenylyltransferase [Candidatus Glassbacteria bacterium]|nr:glucose-1-phosphate adenylyltransferase [Candidatus Glassbacteria bacterium]